MYNVIMKEQFTPSSLGSLPDMGEFVFVDTIDEQGNKVENLDNGRLAKDPAESGDIYIAAEPGSRAGNHPVHSIVKVSVSTADQTRFLLETSHGRKYILRGEGRH